MRRTTIVIALFAAAGCAKHATPAATADYRVIVPKPVSFGIQPVGHQKGLCQAGCLYVPGPGISDDAVLDNMKALRNVPVGEEAEALDNLLFYDEDTRRVIAKGDPLPLTADWQAFLVKQLLKRNVIFQLRVVDDEGKVRATVEPTLMALGVKRHMDTTNNVKVQPIDANGTMVRVGLNHIWYRM